MGRSPFETNVFSCLLKPEFYADCQVSCSKYVVQLQRNVCL